MHIYVSTSLHIEPSFFNPLLPIEPSFFNPLLPIEPSFFNPLLPIELSFFNPFIIGDASSSNRVSTSRFYLFRKLCFSFLMESDIKLQSCSRLYIAISFIWINEQVQKFTVYFIEYSCKPVDSYLFQLKNRELLEMQSTFSLLCIPVLRGGI